MHEEQTEQQRLVSVRDHYMLQANQIWTIECPLNTFAHSNQIQSMLITAAEYVIAGQKAGLENLDSARAAGAAAAVDIWFDLEDLDAAVLHRALELGREMLGNKLYEPKMANVK